MNKITESHIAELAIIGSKYQYIIEQDALHLSTQNRVTSAAGMGFGLFFASSEFVKENA